MGYAEGVGGSNATEGFGVQTPLSSDPPAPAGSYSAPLAGLRGRTWREGGDEKEESRREWEEMGGEKGRKKRGGNLTPPTVKSYRCVIIFVGIFYVPLGLNFPTLPVRKPAALCSLLCVWLSCTETRHCSRRSCATSIVRFDEVAS